MLTVTTRTRSTNGEYDRIECGGYGKILRSSCRVVSSGLETDNHYSTRLKKEKSGLLGMSRIKVNKSIDNFTLDSSLTYYYSGTLKSS